MIAYCARVSNPNNQNNLETESKLLKYLIQHSHWSPYEMSSMCVEIKTGRDIAAQILRHRSFSFQEFSQRYSKVSSYEKRPARRQDLKNKQNSIDDLEQSTKDWFMVAQDQVWNTSEKLYNEALEKGIAKELARSLLPLNTSTTLYMHGTIRSWIHWIEVRSDKSTQLEHRELAEQVKTILIKECPNIAKALGWINE
jgi:thymidylate synthase (FAD)